MKPIAPLAPALRRPLINALAISLACLLTLAGTALHQSRQQAELARLQLAVQQLEQARSAATKAADETRQHLASLGNAGPMAIPVGILPTGAGGGVLEPCGDSASPWERRCARIQLTTRHELPLLEALARWHALSPGQHQLEACRIVRGDDGLDSDCRLVHLRLRDR